MWASKIKEGAFHYYGKTIALPTLPCPNALPWLP